MKKGIPLIYIPVCFSLVFAGIAVDVSRVGKRIQLDGFLIDWKAGERRAWSGSENWFWGALNTPEGVAGYFSTTGVRCSSWTFTAYAGQGASGPTRVIVLSVSDPNTEGISFAATRRITSDSMAVIVAEWIIPWDSLPIEREGNYAINVKGASVCGDSLPPLRFTGNVLTGHGREAPGILLWGILAALAAAAAAGGFTIRKKCPRTQTGHRE